MAWTSDHAMPRWFPDVQEIYDVTGPLDQPGSRYKLRFKTGPRYSCQVVAVEPNQRHDHRFEPIGLMRFSGFATMTFEPQGDQTLFSFDARYDLPLGPVGRLLDWLLLARIAEKRMAAEVPAFKAFVEAEAQNTVSID